MSQVKNTFHIRGIDGLRFVATLVVLAHHIELGKALFNIPSLGKYYLRSGTSQTVMTMFFVLSGFLIFYVLINEKNKTGNIEIKNFYKKRVARIWPVYYLIVIPSLLWFSFYKWPLPISSAIVNPTFGIDLFYLFQLPNFTILFGTSVVVLVHLWSLGAEVQFYLLCPLIIKKTKNYLRAFIIIIAVKLFLKIMVAFSYRLLPLSYESILFLKKLELFLYKLPFEAFAIGGIVAYLFIEKKEKILSFFYQRYIQWINVLVLLASVPLSSKSESIQVLIAINFAVIIINMTGNSKPLILLDNKYSNYIGQISYGIYVYQVPLVLIILNIFQPYYSCNHALLWNVIYYITCAFVTLVVSIISYELMEKRCIKWARK